MKPLMGQVPKLLGQLKSTKEILEKSLRYLTTDEKEIEYVDGEGEQSGSHPNKTQKRILKYLK